MSRPNIHATAIIPDTGWLDATPYLAAGVVPSSNIGMAQFKRVGDDVRFRFKLDLTADMTGNVVAVLPNGFRSGLYQYLPGVFVTTGVGRPASSLAPFDGIPYVNAGVLQVPANNLPPVPGTLVWQGRFDTTDPFPS